MPWGSDGYYSGSGDYDGDGQMGGSNRERYQANKEALGGRQINQRNLDEAARIGALGRDSSGRTVRDSSAYERAAASESASNNASGGGKVAPTPAMKPDYLDMIINAAFTPPTPMPASMRPGGKVAPVPAARPSWYGKPASIHEMQQVQQGLEQGLTLNDIMGGVLGGGAAVLAYEMLKANNAGASPAFKPNGQDAFGAGAGVAPVGPRPRPSGGGTNLTSPRPRIVDGVPVDTDIIDGSFEELFSSGQLGYEPRLQTKGGVTSEVKMVPSYSYEDDGIGYEGPGKTPMYDRPSSTGLVPAVTPERARPGVNSSIDSTMIEPHSDQYYREFGDYLRTQGITDPGQIGITPSNAPQLWEGLTKALQSL